MNEATEIELVREVNAIPLPASDSPVLGAVAGRRRGSALIRSVAPATQAMVLAASGFVAGAAVVGLAARRRGGAARRPVKRRGARNQGGKRSEIVKIVGTRSLLVDVHLLGGAER